MKIMLQLHPCFMLGLQARTMGVAGDPLVETSTIDGMVVATTSSAAASSTITYANNLLGGSSTLHRTPFSNIGHLHHRHASSGLTHLPPKTNSHPGPDQLPTLPVSLAAYLDQSISNPPPARKLTFRLPLWINLHGHFSDLISPHLFPACSTQCL